MMPFLSPGRLAVNWPTLRRSRVLLLLLTLFGATSILVTPATANSRHYAGAGRASLSSEHPPWHTTGIWRRALQQLPPTPAAGPAISTSFVILAADRTARPDPLHNFNKYRGGWDIRNEDYWASVGFTAAPGFIIAAVWLALGILLLLLACFCCCCCRDTLRGDHDGGTCFPLVCLLLFTSAAVAGCVLLYIGEAKLRNELSDTLNYVVAQSNTVSTKLQNFTTVLKNTENIDVVNFALSASDKQQVRQLSVKLANAADTLQTQTKKNAHNIRTVLEDVRLAIIVVAGVMLLWGLLGLLLALLGVTPLVYLLVFIGWFLVAGTWILCGVYILLNNAVGDTCIAMEDWVNNPSAKTNLEDILPCVDVSTANQSRQQTSKLTNETANGINGVISVLNTRATTKAAPLCNPVEPSLSPPGCKNFTDAPEAWKPLVCGTSANATCQFTEGVFSQLNASVKTINDLYVQTPFLVDLADCQFVRQSFTTIKQNYCPGLMKYTKWEYIGLALVSGGLMFSILFWILYSRRRPHRRSVQTEPKPM